MPQDEPANHAILQARLRQTGHMLVCVDSGMEALEKIQSNPQWDVILLDMVYDRRLGVH